MNSTVTVSVKGLLVAALTLLALVTAYLLGGAGGGPAPAAATTPTPAPVAVAPADAEARTLRMLGTGTATVVPDQLGFTLSVTNKQPDLDAALGGANATLARVLTRLKELGVKDADVQTTGLQMSPQYDYPAYGPRVLTGYRVTQKARVTVRELADGGRVVSAAIGAGGNSVRATDLRLGLADPEAALARARDAAVAEATAKAEQYAAATGQTLGAVLGLREMSGPGRGGAREEPLMQRATYDSGSAVPIKAGKDDLDVKVEVLWAFADGDAGDAE